MRTIAVILAAVAALAATAQAFLIWKDRDSNRLNQVYEKRVAICESALHLLDNARRLEDRVEKILMETGELDSLSEEQANEVANALFFQSTYYFVITYGLPDIYFTEKEIPSLGIEETRTLGEKLAGGNRLREASIDQIRETIEAIRMAAAKSDSADALCRPILLNNSN